MKYNKSKYPPIDCDNDKSMIEEGLRPPHIKPIAFGLIKNQGIKPKQNYDKTKK